MALFDQNEFNRFAVENGVIDFLETPRRLSSGRKTHWYANWRAVTGNANTLDVLTYAILEFAAEQSVEPYCFYGVPEGATTVGLFTQSKLIHTLQLAQVPDGDQAALRRLLVKKLGGRGERDRDITRIIEGAVRACGSSHSGVIPLGRIVEKTHGDPRDKYFVCAPEGDTVIIEDVTTTGDSVLAEIEKVRRVGANPLAVIALTNRMERRADGLSVEESVHGQGVQYVSLSNARDLLPLAYAHLQPDDEIADKVEREFLEHSVGGALNLRGA